MDPMAIAALMGTRQAPSRTSSTQQMLDAEKKFKLDRIPSGSQSQPGSPPPPDSPRRRPPLQLRRADSLSEQPDKQMLKAIRRGVTMPSLSITIPPYNGGGKTSKAQRKTKQKAGSDHGVELELGQEPEDDDLTPDAMQKSVKFLGADDDESDGESIQSSICHSPSWEGYGAKKKEKKKEAERKRREKEQAEREAKAAKRRLSSRLSKHPPLTSRNSQMNGTPMNRSNSAPLLANLRSMPPSSKSFQASHIHDDIEVDELAVQDENVIPFIGGLKFEQEREAAVNATLDSHLPVSPKRSHQATGPADEIRQYMQKTYSSGPSMNAVHTSRAATQLNIPSRHESRSPRESRPPSASRTPLLAQAGHARPQSHHQPQSRNSKSRDADSRQSHDPYTYGSQHQDSYRGVASSSDRGRPDDSYVMNQRHQNNERAMAGLVDDQLYTGYSSQSSSTRSSSRQTVRSSGSYDATPHVSQLSTGYRNVPVVRAGHSSASNPAHHDYFSAQEQPRSSPPRKTSPLATGVSGLTKSRSNSNEARSRPESLRYREPSSSTATSGLGMIRNLRDVAKATFQRPSSQQSLRSVTDNVPTYHNSPERNPSSAPLSAVKPAASAPKKAVSPKAAPVNGEYQKSSVQSQQPGSRVSEGSSSSSNYDDVSPLPSPATTPDTSRPQSAKGQHRSAHANLTGRPGPFTLQDDERTVRQSSPEDEGGSGSSGTERNPGSRDSGGEEMMTAEDRWSRTALPMDIDFDAQSTTSFLHLDDESGVGSQHQQVQHIADQNGLLKVPGGRLRLSKSHSDPDLRQTAMDMSFLPPLKHQPLVPRRSKARGSPVEHQQSFSPVKQQYDEGGYSEDEYHQQPWDEFESRPHQRMEHVSIPENTLRRADELHPGVQFIDDAGVLHDAAGVPISSVHPADVVPSTGGFLPSLEFSDNSFFIDVAPADNMVVNPGMVPVQVTTTQVTYAQSQAPAAAGAVGLLDPATITTQTPRQGSPLPTSDTLRRHLRHTSSQGPINEFRNGQSSKPVAAPVSILKPKPMSQHSASPALDAVPAVRPQVLSAIPKHLQPHLSTRLPATGPPDIMMAPIAKMFVECCSCHFYHDMPSKLYECMVKPDAVVQDQLLGISGAITTMVKCPWCQHNMSTKCCAGYAAVVYRKERLH